MELFPHGCQRRSWISGAIEAGRVSSVGAACGVTVLWSLYPPVGGGGRCALGPPSSITSSSLLSLALRFPLPEAPGAEKEAWGSQPLILGRHPFV